MKNYTATNIYQESLKSKEIKTAGIGNAGEQHNSVWLEFEDSFIQILSGIEPCKKYYYTTEIQRKQPAC